MRKEEATQQFKEMYKEELERKPQDKPLIRQAWNVYTDGLHRDRVITDKQRNNWLNPFVKE